MILFLIITLIIIVVIGYGIIRYNEPKFKGLIGEHKVAKLLATLNPQEYKVINNLLIRYGNRSSQIDHVVISRFGIFVIETKNYQGWIHGGENSEYWTQSIYHWKNRFRNPIKQNQSHIYALNIVLREYGYIDYHSIIVFTGSAELKNVYSKIPVLYSNELCRVIINNYHKICLTTGQIDGIVHKLNHLNLSDKKTNKEHVNQIRSTAYKRDKNTKFLVCPICGGELVLRNGPYGEFYGCSNYPRCRYVL